MATLNAASRLRRDVLNIPFTVLLVRAGHPDRVIRFNRLPEIIKTYRDRYCKERNLSEFPTTHTALNLDNGPDSETWDNAMREMNSNARRDIPLPLPIYVAPSSQEEWNVGPEDVPVVEMNELSEDAKRGPGRPRKEN